MKNVLWLEDEENLVEAVKNVYGKKCNFTVVSNFSELKGHLFDSPGIEAYDCVILDLTIETPGAALSICKRKIPKMFKDKDGNYVGTTMVAGISMLGWDFYNRVVCVDDRFKDCKDSKFVLVTGNRTLVERSGVADNLAVKIVEKRGGEDFPKELASFLE